MKILNGSELEKYANENNIVLIDFYASWCGPCVMQSKILEEYDKVKPNCVAIAKINVDEEMDLAEKYEIIAVPTLCVFKEGKLVYRHEGYMDLNELKAKVELYVTKMT